MEQATILNEILNALKLHGDHTDKKLEIMDRKFDEKFELMKSKFDEKFNLMEDKFEELNAKMDEGFASVNQNLDKIGKRVDGIRVELTETQETTDFILNKIAQHEKKLRQLSGQHL